MAASTGWNDLALLMVFRSVLQTDVQTKLACRDEDLMLDQLIAIASLPSPSLTILAPH